MLCSLNFIIKVYYETVLFIIVESRLDCFKLRENNSCIIIYSYKANKIVLHFKGMLPLFIIDKGSIKTIRFIVRFAMTTRRVRGVDRVGVGLLVRECLFVLVSRR